MIFMGKTPHDSVYPVYSIRTKEERKIPESVNCDKGP